MPKLTAVRLTGSNIDSMALGTQIWDSKVTGLGVRATSKGSRSFLLRYRVNGTKQQKYVTLGKYPTLTVDEARSLALDNLKIVSKGGDPAAENEALRASANFLDLVEYYCGEYAEAANLKDRTVKDARTVLGPMISKFGRIKVKDITVTQVRKAHGDARKVKARKQPPKVDGQVQSKPILIDSPYQANRLLAVLSRMFTLARELHWRADNPCTAIDKFPENQRWQHLSEDEVGRLLRACDGYEGQNAANAIRLLIYTGARLNEALKAPWAQFDLAKGVWDKPSAHTKQKRQHRLELEGPALELLIAMRGADPDGIFLFPGRPDKKGRVIKARSDLKRPWAAITKQAQLAGYRLHDLRRTTASFMLDGQASLETVGKALGQTQPSTTARYAQLSQSVQRKALGKAGEHMAAQKTASTGPSA